MIKSGVVTTKAKNRPSISARGVYLRAGKWYFEINIITPGRAFVGWDEALNKGNSVAAPGIGVCAHSWGLDGFKTHSQLTLYDKREEDSTLPLRDDGRGAPWARGDVIGCCVSIGTDSKADMSFYRNGDLISPGFQRVQFDRALCPVVSFDREFTFVVNFGTSAFRQVVPKGARSPHYWARQQVRCCTVLRHASH